MNSQYICTDLALAPRISCLMFMQRPEQLIVFRGVSLQESVLKLFWSVFSVFSKSIEARGPPPAPPQGRQLEPGWASEVGSGSDSHSESLAIWWLFEFVRVRGLRFDPDLIQIRSRFDPDSQNLRNLRNLSNLSPLSL